MDRAILVRDASIASNLLVNKGQTLVAKEDCSFIVPSRYFNGELGSMSGDTTEILNCLALYDRDKKYCVINSNNLISVSPVEIYDIVVDGKEYKELFFSKGSIIMDNTKVVRSESIIYEMLREFIFLGNIPWYMDYNDLATIYDTAKSHAGSNAVNNIIVVHILVSIIARGSKDRSKYYRTTKGEDTSFIPLSNIWNSYNNTTSKIVGSYMKSGITAALVEQSTSTTRVEKIIRQ